MFSLKFLPQKYISKTVPSENTFQIMSYKLAKTKCIFVILRQNIAPSKNIFKTASWNNTFLKPLPQKIHFQNCSIKKNIPKNLFKKLFPQKIHFQISSSKIFFKKIALHQTLSKLLPKKRHFQNCFLKKNQPHIFDLFFIRIIRFTRRRRITQIIINMPNCFFLNVFTLISIPFADNNFYLFSEDNLKLWLQSTLEIFLS